MVEEDHLKFNAADKNKDGSLDEQEYVAFEFPYDFEHMHDIEMNRAMKDYDKNSDGFVTLEEFLGEGKATLMMFRTCLDLLFFQTRTLQF